MKVVLILVVLGYGNGNDVEVVKIGKISMKSCQDLAEVFEAKNGIFKYVKYEATCVQEEVN